MCPLVSIEGDTFFFSNHQEKCPKITKFMAVLGAQKLRAKTVSSIRAHCSLHTLLPQIQEFFFKKKNWYSSDPVFLRIYDFIQVSTRIELNLLRRNSSVCMSWETFVCDRFETIKCWSWRECQHSTRSRCRHMRLTINIVCWWNTALFYIA